jgi:predicted amidohydrolase
VFDPDGRRLVQSPYHQEALTLAELDLAQLTRTRARLPLLRDERTALTLRELLRIQAAGTGPAGSKEGGHD